MQNNVKILILLTMLLASGCANQGQILSDTQNSVTELRIYNEQCLFEGEAAAPALLAPIVTSVLSNSLSRFGSALRKLGEEETYTETDYRNFQITTDKPFRCIQVVKGNFGTPDASLTVGLKQPKKMPQSINLTGKPHFFIELMISRSANGQFLALTPTYFEYNRLLKNGAAINTKRTLALQFSFHAAGKAADDRSAVGTTLGLGQVPVGTVRDYRFKPYSLDLQGAQSLWFPTFVPAKKGGEAASSSSTNPQPGDSSGSAGDADMVPMTMSVTVAETRSARPFIIFLADVFDDTKDEIQTELELLLLREKREAAKLAEFTAQQAALTALKSKIADAESKFLDYCDMGTGTSTSEKKARLNASNSLYAAQVAANLAARKAGEADPYPVLVEVSSEPPAGCP